LTRRFLLDRLVVARRSGREKLHFLLEGAPNVAVRVPEAGGGWSWILSDPKTLLETGASLAG